MIARRALLLVLLAALAFGLGLAGCEWGATEDAPVTTTVAEVPIPGPTPDVAIDPDQEQDSAARPPGPAEHQDAVDETPPGVTPSDVEKIEESQPAGIGEPKPLGGAENLSCREHFVRNFSDRAAGSTVSMALLHYTVSAPGSLDAIWNLFNTPSFGASSHLLLEPLTGRCELLVPYSKKAWTQGAFNSVADSVEIVCCTSDPPRSWWLGTKIIKEGLLAEWVVDRLRARGLPPRLVNPAECSPLAGYTDHERLECGNTHTDVGRNFPWDVFQKQVTERFRQASTVSVWRAVSGGEVLEQKRAEVRDGVSGYERLLRWMKGSGERKVKRAEAENGNVRVLKVSVAR